MEGLDFDQTFAPVVELSILLAILTFSALPNLEIYQMDVKAAYLNSKLKEEIKCNLSRAWILPKVRYHA